MKKVIILCLFTLFVVVAFSQVTKTVNLSTAGTLSSLLTANEKTTVTDLTLTGSIDARDFKCMRDEMTKLAVLDISAVKIDAYSGIEGTGYANNTYSSNELPEYAFCTQNSGKKTLKDIKLPSSISSINNWSFNNCIGLTTFSISYNINEIEENAFSGCSGISSFDVSLDNLYYKSSDGVLYDKNITKIIAFPSAKSGIYNFPNSIQKSYYNIYNLDECYKLTAIKVDVSNQSFSSLDGVLFNKEKTALLAFPKGRQGSYSLPQSVTSLMTYLFDGSKGLTILIIPKHIEIEENYLSKCTSLIKVEAPANFVNITEGLFTDGYENYGGDGYEDFYLPSNISKLKINGGIINDRGYLGIKSTYRTLKILDLSEALNETLSISGLQDLNLLDTLILPANLKEIPYKGIAECVSLDSIFIPATVEKIGMRAFENCRSMKNVIFAPNSQLKTIDNWAFYACHGLIEIVIPNGVTSVGDGAFWGCEYLSDLSLPSSVQKINDNGFDGCIGLNKIKVEATIPPVVSAKTFNRVNKNASLYVPDASLTMYKNAFGWKDFFNIKGISTQVQELEELSYGIRVIDKNIEITNAKGSKINVYDISGRMLFTKTVSQDSENIQLSNKGIYLLAIDGLNRKIRCNGQN